MVGHSPYLAVSLAAAIAVGCAPNLDGGASLVTRAELLAISSEPAEAKPGDSVAYTALYAAPEDSPDSSGLQWGFCTVQKPLAFIGPVAPECLSAGAPDLLSLGSGAEVKGSNVTIPQDACATFGPTPAEPKPGAAPTRPTDPDTTGGYYQPVVVLVPVDPTPDYVVGVTRLDCGLGGATQEQAIDYAKRYRPNANPVIDSLTMTDGSGDVATIEDAAVTAAATLSPGQQVSFSARWAACPTSPACGDSICSAGEDLTSCAADCAKPSGCTGSEPYPLLDTSTHSLVDHRETIRISWFATAGQFLHDNTGRSEAEFAEVSSDNDWVAPKQEGTVKLWVVIRDDRGGATWRTFRVDVHS